MGIDTTIRYNDHNSYKITADLLGYPFAVQDITHLTHSFAAYATAGLAHATRAKTLFFDADGAKLSEVSHDFAVTTIFEKVEITVPVPSTAMQAQLMLIRGSSDWWIAEPKSEQGEIATPYNVNYAGQMTYITPNGVYTGFVAAHQIVVSGTAANPDETLETRLVTINQNAINVSATVSTLDGAVSGHSTRLTTIEAGQITLSNTVSGHNTRLTTIEAGQITLTNTVNSKVGVGVNYKGVTIDATNGFTSTATVGGKTIVTKANSIDGLLIYNGSTKVFGVDTSGRVFTQSISNLEDSSWYATMGVLGTNEQGLVLYSSTTPKYLQITESNGGVLFLDRNLKTRITLGANITSLHDINNTLRFYADGISTQLMDSSGTQRFYAGSNSTILIDSSGIQRFSAGTSNTVIRSPDGNTYVLATNSGISIVVNGVTKASW